MKSERKAWLYDRDHGGKIFQGDAIARALKDGWQDNPKFEEPKEAKVKAKTKAKVKGLA
jgi:hypothetical protein